ncbi:aminodeoxychorismate synthase, component I [Sphingorhabdus lutea]|uniref:Probable branched-chain-amino-acid aminotransferase n=1 Tax=Sphingorhabdus lutea TaxID=1913578 RepID=A0A1L3J9B3_9SPHN|nr:aminodeoxychorismate synthase component I [Sphingorhabdus lutea]APG61726.1 aminodeoxychorismate synthase, component I [Sphingorhabdus lutea]
MDRKINNIAALSGPFILLDDARASGAAPSRLYINPIDILTTHHPAELPDIFASMETYKQQGKYAAGFISYEAGLAMEGRTLPKLPLPDNLTQPLLWFAIFDDFETFNSEEIATILPSNKGAILGDMQPQIEQAEYQLNFEKLIQYINNGDIYQANYTFANLATLTGSPLSLYAALRPRARAGYGGIIWTGSQWHLSFSPELFFSVKSGKITTRPMKGTAPRHHNPVEDKKLAHILAHDEKQRAENLMIVDLLRNDISRICVAGSVRADKLFHVESYPTVHQMTSTIEGELKGNVDFARILRAIYPCGSITGAPKIRAMEIIDELEISPRGIYCGSIGRLDPDGDMAFNVAIRTISLAKTDKPQIWAANLGLGSGIVADSLGENEWRECLLKGEFTKIDKHAVDLIETMRFDPAHGILRLEAHLARLKNSASDLKFMFDRHEARNMLHAATFHIEHISKVRLLLSHSGAMSIAISPIKDGTDRELRVIICPMTLSSDDYRLRYKCTDRAFYDEPRRAASHVDEVIFCDDNGNLTEGSFTNIFVPDGKDGFITPPLKHGLQPGILRAEMIDEGIAVEGDITAQSLSDGFFVGNSMRGLMRARIILVK